MLLSSFANNKYSIRYDGNYGGKSGWEVPILSQFGVSGTGGTDVKVPVNPTNIGEPISVGQNFGIGNFFGAGDNVGADWFNGQVGGKKGWSVPIIGLSGSSGSSVSFPSLGDFLNIGDLRKGYSDLLSNAEKGKK